MYSSGGSRNLQDEVDPEYNRDGTQSCCEDGRHQELADAVHEDAQDSPGKILLQSVYESLAQSALSVKAIVSGNATSAPSSDGNAEENVVVEDEDKTLPVHEEEKTLVQSVGERIVQSAQSMKESARESAQSIQEAVIGDTGGEDKTVLQAVGEKIVQSAKTVKDAVKGDVHIIPGDDEGGEHSILIHNILD